MPIPATPPRRIEAVRSVAETPEARAAEYDHLYLVYEAASRDAQRLGLKEHARFCWAKANAYLDAWEAVVEGREGDR